MTKSKIQLVDRKTGDSFAAAPDESVLFSSADLGWRGITVELHRITPLEMPEHYIEGHRLAINIHQPVQFEWKDGSRWRQILLKPGDFCLQTHGELNFPRWNEDFEFLAIAPEFVSQAFQDTTASDRLTFRERRGEFDPEILHFAHRFKTELMRGTFCGVLYGESLALAFALHLIEAHSDRCPKLRRPVGKLSSRQLRQVVEYIHEQRAGGFK